MKQYMEKAKAVDRLSDPLLFLFVTASPRNDPETVSVDREMKKLDTTSVDRYNNRDRLRKGGLKMLINEQLEKQNLTKYRLSRESGVPQATINDICSGKADLEKCSAGTLYRLAKVLGISIEDILESAKTENRSAFETFKSNTCHHVKDMGDLDFIVDLLEKDEIRKLYRKKWYPEALYLLAMLDYLCRVNDLPICTKYEDIRSGRLSKPTFPAGVLLTCEVLKTEEPMRNAEKEAIPEFRRFNIMESEVRNVV